MTRPTPERLEIIRAFTNKGQWTKAKLFCSDLLAEIDTLRELNSQVVVRHIQELNRISNAATDRNAELSENLNIAVKTLEEIANYNPEYFPDKAYISAAREALAKVRGERMDDDVHVPIEINEDGTVKSVGKKS